MALARQGPRASHWDLWIAELERGTEVRFTSDASINRNPVWAPDGARIVFSSSRAGRTDLYEKDVTGTDQEDPIIRSNSPKNAGDWSRDGELLLYEETGRSSQGRISRDIFALPVKGGGKPVALLRTEFNESQPQLSSDRRWLAYMSDESGARRSLCAAVRGEWHSAGQSEIKRCFGGQMEGVARRGTEPRWRNDGRELFFLNGNTLMVASVTTTGGNLEMGVPRGLFEIPPLASPLLAPSFRYAVSGDGKRFLVLMDPPNTAPPPLTVVVNWQRATKQ